MSALLPSENTCCNPCEEPLTVAVPGPKGDPAEPCTPCVDGQGAFTTADSFAMPAELANTGSILVGNSDWMALGEAVFASGGGIVGTMEVVSKADSTHVVLKNLEDTGNGLYPENSPPGSVFPPLTLITPIGRQGATGATPAGTAPNTATYITQTPDAGLTSEQPLSALATGYMKSTTGTGVVSTQAVPIPVADGGTGGITAAAARTSLSAAPSTATFITQTADAGLSAEQALASLATGYMKVTTATGVVSSQAVPIPVADGGTGGITAAAARSALGLNPVITDWALIREEYASGNNGGTFTSGAWQTRALNTEVADTGNYVSVAASQITFQPGTYRMRALAVGNRVNQHQTRLYNITAGSVIAVGLVNVADSSNQVSNVSETKCRVTFVGVTVVELQHRCTTTKATDGFGLAATFGNNEVFSSVEIEREAG